MMRPCRLTRGDRWLPRLGKRFYFAIIDVGHADAVYMRLFDTAKALGYYLRAVRSRGVLVLDRGRIRWKRQPLMPAVR